MKKLLKHFKGYTKETVLAPLFKLLEALFELFVPLVVKKIIDDGIENNDTGLIIQMCLVLVLLAVIGIVTSVTAQYFASKASVGFAKKVRHTLFSHIQRLSYSEIDRVGTSTLITRLTSDVNQIQTGINMTLRLFLRSPIVVFGSMIMAFLIDVKSALIFVVMIPLLSAIVFGIILGCVPLYKKVQAAVDKILGITRENLTGARVIRAFGVEETESRKFTESNNALTKAQDFVGKISALLNPATYVIVNIAIIVLIWTGAVRVDAGILKTGEVVALYNYMSQILVELVKLANLIITMTKSIACAKRVSDVLDIEPDIIGAEAIPSSIDSDIAVEFNNVTLRYNASAEPALENIDFSVKKGQTIGIIGGTGSGKSSLINLIPRFYDVESGEVKVDGINVKDYPLDTLREKIGTVPQKAVLFKGTLRENMQWGKNDATDEEIMDAIEIAQVSSVVKSKQNGLDMEIEQGGKNLSGGQRQRFTIARALVGRPEIIILDDSSSALDFATDAALRKAIASIDYGPTVFIVSQRTSSIQSADKIIVLDDGIAVGIGRHDELLRNCDVYKEIYNSQFKREDKND